MLRAYKDFKVPGPQQSSKTATLQPLITEKLYGKMILISACK